jgi:hypothetical protein
MLNAGHLGVPQEWFNDGWIYSNETALGCRPPKLRRTFDINRYVEEIVSDPLGVLQGISRHLGVAPPAEQPMTTLRTLRNEQSERWCERSMRELPPGLREVVDVDSRRSRLGST